MSIHSHLSLCLSLYDVSIHPHLSLRLSLYDVCVCPYPPPGPSILLFLSIQRLVLSQVDSATLITPYTVRYAPPYKLVAKEYVEMMYNTSGLTG